MSAKEFLIQECENLKSVLEETLRYKYGPGGSREFFEECEIRRGFIAQELKNTNENEFSALQEQCQLLNELSALISRIERSSIGEYSWPFVEELKKIAIAICKESTLTDPDTPPNVHVLSDGGLDTYRIYPERKRPSASKKRILTIVFPRTLKHFVLLHPILGHEIGHAIWRCSKHEPKLRNIIEDALVKNDGRFSNSAATANWLYLKNAPVGVQSTLSKLGSSHGVTEHNFFQRANWEAWKEEILCDLIGLIIFGPSFVAAHCELLYALIPSGEGFGIEHPPNGCRVNMMLTAARLMGYNNTTALPSGHLKDATVKFWKNLHSKRQPNPWFDIFTDKQIKAALDGIGALLNLFPPTHYPIPTDKVIKELFDQLINKVPPVGFRMDKNKTPECYTVDFRHILYVGWIASQHTEKMPFLILNRLCEHAITQQRGIDTFQQKDS